MGNDKAPGQNSRETTYCLKDCNTTRKLDDDFTYHMCIKKGPLPRSEAVRQPRKEQVAAVSIPGCLRVQVRLQIKIVSVGHIKAQSQ